MKNQSASIDRDAVDRGVRTTYGKIREALGFAGYREAWEGEAGHHKLVAFVGGKLGVVIVQLLHDRGHMMNGIEVFSPLVQTNSIQDTLDAIMGKPSRIERAVDSFLSGVSSRQNEEVARLLNGTDADVDELKNKYTTVPVMYPVIAQLIQCRRPL